MKRAKVAERAKIQAEEAQQMAEMQRSLLATWNLSRPKVRVP